MRTISNKEAREMADTRKIMAAALISYRLVKRFESDALVVDPNGGKTVRWMARDYSRVEYERATGRMWAEADGADGQLVQIMIFE